MDTSRYAELFLTESREHLSAINHALLEMERSGGTADTVGALFRAVHTVKGMSATMGYDGVADLSHELETLLERVRKNELGVTSGLMDALFKAADTLEWSIESAVTGRTDDRAAKAIVGLKAFAPGDAAAPRRKSGATAIPGKKGKAKKEAALSDAPGLRVRLRVADDAPLPGVRALLALQKAKGLGTVADVEPPEVALSDDDFDRHVSFRLVTATTPTDVALALRQVGDIESVDIDGVPIALPMVAPAGQPADGPIPVSLIEVEATGVQKQRHVRIDLRRLDALMNLIGELVITRGRLIELAREIGNPGLDDSITQASRLIADLQDEIMTCRMVPVWQVFDRFPRLVRDAARTLGKEVSLEIEGKDIELDRSMLDEIGDPIVHLLRNAVDHGIERPADRAMAGKPAVGRLTLSASRDRSAVLIRVSDDGRGIDRHKVLQKAQETGLIDRATVELTDEELMRLISRPGFSTAEAVTEISGRGVGIDAVQNRVRALGGSVDIKTAPGHGTTVTARLPLTLAIMRALLAKVGDEMYAVPMVHVRETISMEGATLSSLQGKPVLVLREVVMPLIRLRERVGMPGAIGLDEAEQAIIVELADREAAMVVDELPGQQEIVVKQFDGVRGGSQLFSGATILGDGQPALIVDVSSLL
ncbi:MAG TPA: chemotaxis protein CheA [Gemmatimonadaceae bacterium]|nr:chemotaxis protein CheA [Gemmatimonadaceae bacterium]